MTAPRDPAVATLAPIVPAARRPSLVERLRDGLPRPARRAGGRQAAWAMLAPLLLIPAATGLGAAWLAGRTEAQNAALEQAAGPRIAAVAEAAALERARPRAARLFGGVTVSAVVEGLARVLPEEADVHALGRDPDGALVIVVETLDPDRLRPALAADPLFGGMREIAQESVADRGMRVTFRADAP